MATARGNSERRCEAHYYAGEVYRLAGDLKRAQLCFEQCVRTGVRYDLDTLSLNPMNEWELARWRLEQLEQKR